MGARTFHQYFGPSPRHGRACVEIRFDRTGRTHRLASFAPFLRAIGFKLVSSLPAEPVPEEEAVARLAGALLSRNKPWWTAHGGDGDAGWAAIDFPMPRVAANALDVAHLLLAYGPDLPPVARNQLAKMSRWMANASKIRQWMPGIAGMFDREVSAIDEPSDIYQVGQGAKGVQFFRIASQFDSLLAPRIEGNKFSTVQLLRRFGMPTTKAVLVKAGDALGPAIARVGLPCVVKPLTFGRGVGVVTGLDSEAAVSAAVRHALSLGGEQVQIENHVEGDDHRIIVANDELLWAYRKVRPSVVGDGATTVRELIDRENRRRDEAYSRDDGYLDPIVESEEMRQFLVARHGIGIDGVLEKGRQIEVVSQGNTSRGAYLEDATGRMHPDNRALAIRLARLFRLRTAGIDFLTPDISRSWKEIPCAVIEINRTPGLSGYGDAVHIHRTFFRNRRSGMIPTIAIIGDDAYRARAAGAFRKALSRCGLRVGAAEYSGRDSRESAITPWPVAPSVETLWLDPEADAALILCNPDQVETAGLPLRRCDLLLVEDGTRFAWLGERADTVIEGAVSQAVLDRAAGELAARYADPTEGGPAPVLDPLDEGPNGQFRVKVWRARAMPRGWFWDQVGIEPDNRDGLTTHDDLLVAAHALAAKALGEGGADLAPFAYRTILSSWARVSFEASVALPDRDREAARAALIAAAERVNAIAVPPSS